MLIMLQDQFRIVNTSRGVKLPPNPAPWGIGVRRKYMHDFLISEILFCNMKNELLKTHLYFHFPTRETICVFNS